MTDLANRYAGCLLGTALGDAAGAPWEGGVLERMLWGLIGRTPAGLRRWTDDTRMTLDVVESLLVSGTIIEDELAWRFAASHRWSRGYGPGTTKVLRRIRAGRPWQVASRSVHPEGSHGNGAAMRAAILGLCFHSDADERRKSVRAASVVTHAHPLAIEAAQMMAAASAASVGAAMVNQAPADGVWKAVIEQAESAAWRSRLSVATNWLADRAEPTPAEVRRSLGNGMAAVESTVTALYLAMRFLQQPFNAMIEFTRHVGGDVDTLASMAGGIWGAFRGSADLPPEELSRLEACEDIEGLGRALYSRFEGDRG